MSSSDSGPNYDLLDQLVEEFNDRLRRGERPSVQEYCDRHPGLAADLRDLLPAVAVVEQAKGEPAAEQRAPAKLPNDFGDFHLLREVGHGGMGVVYEAEQVSLGRRVALKVLTRRLLRDDKQKRRFEREARAAGRLHHTNIVPVFGVGEHDGIPYYVMQFIPGQGLDAVVEDVAALEAGAPARSAARDPAAAGLAHSLVTDAFQKPDPDQEMGDPTLTAPGGVLVSPVTDATAPHGSSASVSAVSGVVSAVSGSGGTGSGRSSRTSSYWRGVARIGAQVAGALEYAHQQGVVHRDVKPSNLLLDAAGTAWVTDFGLAKASGTPDDLTHTGDVLGTLRYMPPEAFEGKSDARSDIYALGLTLYEMLALRPAFDERNREQLIKQVTTGVPIRLRKARPGVPRDLDTIVHKAIDRDPARRYATAGELYADLRRYLDDEPIRARRQTAAEAAWRWARRHPSVAGMAISLLAVVFAGTAAVVWKWREAERNAVAADANALAARQSAAEADESARQSREAAERADRSAADASHAVEQYLLRVTADPRLQDVAHTPLRRELLVSARDFYLKFVAERKDDRAARRGLADAYMRLSVLTHNIEKDNARALDYAQRAVVVLEGLLAEAPEDPRRMLELANCLRNMALGLREANRHDECDTAIDRAVALQERALALTGNDNDRIMLASILRSGGIVASPQRPDRALAHYTREAQLRAKLAAEQPGSLDRKYELGYCADRQAYVLAVLLNDPLKAAERYQVAIGVLREVVKTMPGNATYRSNLGLSLHRYARYCLLSSPVEDARKTVEEAIGHLRFAFEQNRTANDRDRLRDVFRAMGEVWLRAGDYNKAANAAVDAGQLLPSNPSTAFYTVEQLHRCAAQARARQDLTAADAETYARAILNRAEPYRSVAARFTPTSDSGKLVLARWLAEPPNAPEAHLTHARELARQVTVNSPSNQLAWTVVGISEYRMATWYEAREALERAMAIPVKVASPAPYFLAMTLWHIGEADAAKSRLAAAKSAGDRIDLDPVRIEAEITLGLAPVPPARTWSVLVDADHSAYLQWINQMTATQFEPMFVNAAHAGGRVRYSATAASGWPAQLTCYLRRDKGVVGFQARFDGATADKFWIAGLVAYSSEDTAEYVSIWKRPAGATGYCRHLLTHEGFRKDAEEKRARGHRPVSVSGFAYGGGHRFAAVYGASGGDPWELTDGLSMKDLTEKLDVWRSRGFRPAVIFNYPEAGQVRFGAVLVQDVTFAAWEVRVGLTGEQYREADDQLRKKGYRPDQIVCYDDDGTARFVGVWVRERSPLAVPFRPMTGTPVRELAAFDRAMQTYMRKRDISAASLAVMKNGNVVLSRGYGFADKDEKVRTAPDELFRLASVSKPITAAAVYKLIRDGKLKSDDSVWDLLKLAAPPGKKADPRWTKVTIAHLLEHKGGWDRDKAGDPMFKPLLIAKALGKPGPATAEDVIAYMAGEPLQFEPGSKSVYSNFGYCLLGRMIEKASGRPYIDYVREAILAPIGIKRVALGRTLPTDRDPAEPFYEDEGLGRDVMRPGQKEMVLAPDGTFYLEAMDAHGGLIGPANELVQFLETYKTNGQLAGPKPAPGAFFGALPGTFTMLYQRADGVAVVALFNRWHDPGGHDPFEIRRLIDQAADSIQSWPTAK